MTELGGNSAASRRDENEEEPGKQKLWRLLGRGWLFPAELKWSEAGKMAQGLKLLSFKCDDVVQRIPTTYINANMAAGLISQGMVGRGMGTPELIN